MKPAAFATRLAADRPEASIPPEKKPWGASEALIEASRCLYCYNAPCSRGCPAGVDVPEFIRSIRSGAYRAADRMVLSANALAESCGCVCPTEMLCVGECVLSRIDGQQPIAIGRLQRFAAGWARPSNDALRQHYTLETFYRFHLTDNLAITPDLQLILNPSLAPAEDALWVGALRVRSTF